MYYIQDIVAHNYVLVYVNIFFFAASMMYIIFH